MNTLFILLVSVIKFQTLFSVWLPLANIISIYTDSFTQSVHVTFLQLSFAHYNYQELNLYINMKQADFKTKYYSLKSSGG